MSRRLDRPMVLEAASRIPDGAGGHVETWVPLGELWAAVEVAGGSESGEPLAAESRLTLRIVVRAAPEGALARPRPGQRLVEGARRYRIVAVAEADALGRYLTCFAREERVA